MKIDKSLLNIRKLELSELDAYFDNYQFIKAGMEHPEWLGDFTKEALKELISTTSVILVWTFLSPLEPLTKPDDFVTSGMLIPARQEDLDSFLCHDMDYTETIDFGPEMVHPKYRGNGLQLDVIKFLENLAASCGYKYGLGTVCPDNVYSRSNLVKAGFMEHSIVELPRGTRVVLKKELHEDPLGI